MSLRYNLKLGCGLTFFFTVFIYAVSVLLFDDTLFDSHISENEFSFTQNAWDTKMYASFSGVTQADISQITNKIIFEWYKKNFFDSQKSKIAVWYISGSLKQKIENTLTPILESFLKQDFIKTSVSELSVLLYEQESDTRWRMRNRNIHLFWVQKYWEEELMSVFIHEFWHYYDIYSNRDVDKSLSSKFYSISWEDISIITWGQNTWDFVSGYAMTNQFEDYAESYMYYTLHNSDFYEKSRNTVSLARKYNFFKDEVFPNWEYINTNFSWDQPILSYYWDITKLEVDIKKFLQYTQNNL